MNTIRCEECKNAVPFLFRVLVSHKDGHAAVPRDWCLTCVWTYVLKWLKSS